MEESERMLKDRLQRAESQRLEVEDELSRCKMNIANERLVTDDQLSSAKQRIRTEEVSLSHCSSDWCGSIVYWLRRWTYDREVAGSTPAAAPSPGSNSGQVVHTHVPLSPSSIIWYRPRGGDALRLAGIALAMHCSTDSVVYPPTGSTPPTPLLGYGPLPYLLTTEEQTYNSFVTFWTLSGK